MKKSISKLCLFIFVALLFTACHKDKETTTIDASLLPGCWQKYNSTEFWRYDSDGSGETWVEDDDVHEGEGTNFTWTVVNNSQLRVTLVGEMGQEVPRDYTITLLSSTSLYLLENFYDTVYTFSRAR